MWTCGKEQLDWSHPQKTCHKLPHTSPEMGKCPFPPREKERRSPQEQLEKKCRGRNVREWLNWGELERKAINSEMEDIRQRPMHPRFSGKDHGGKVDGENESEIYFRNQSC